MRLRAPRIDDAPAVAELLRARDLADLGEPQTTVEEVRHEWRSGLIDPAHDVRVAVVGPDIIGYAVVAVPGSVACVSPAHEGSAVGGALLDWSESRELAQSRDVHRRWVAHTDTRGQERLAARGYEPVRSYYRMIIDLPVPVHVAADDGTRGQVRLRRLDVAADAEALHVIDDDAFAERADYMPQSLDEFVADHLRAPGLDPGLSRVATRGGQLIAFALVHRCALNGSGHVALLAVHPEHRGHGIGTDLLGGVFDGCSKAGLRSVHLSVASDNSGAQRLYRRLGMRRRHRFDVFECAAGSAAR